MQYNKKERIIAGLKDFFGWVTVTAIAFVWWLAVLLIFSLVLMSIWQTSLEAILSYTVVLTIVTSLIYLVWLVYRRFVTKTM
jgi:hypothetical protein